MLFIKQPVVSFLSCHYLSWQLSCLIGLHKASIIEFLIRNKWKSFLELVPHFCFCFWCVQSIYWSYLNCVYVGCDLVTIGLSNNWYSFWRNRYSFLVKPLTDLVVVPFPWVKCFTGRHPSGCLQCMSAWLFLCGCRQYHKPAHDVKAIGNKQQVHRHVFQTLSHVHNSSDDLGVTFLVYLSFNGLHRCHWTLSKPMLRKSRNKSRRKLTQLSRCRKNRSRNVRSFCRRYPYYVSFSLCACLEHVTQLCEFCQTIFVGLFLLKGLY